MKKRLLCVILVLLMFVMVVTPVSASDVFVGSQVHEDCKIGCILDIDKVGAEIQAFNLAPGETRILDDGSSVTRSTITPRALCIACGGNRANHEYLIITCVPLTDGRCVQRRTWVYSCSACGAKFEDKTTTSYHKTGSSNCYA